MTQFLHVQCREFGLLVNVDCIHEVIGNSQSTLDQGALPWRDQHLPLLNLTARLTGQTDEVVGDYLVLSSPDTDRIIAVGVSQVANIESLNDDAFSDIPFLDFPFNDYFDKAYVHPTTQECIYRLKDITRLLDDSA